ncbi:MAG: transglycosylase SLT domain-containing protein [Bacteroidales bacterium]|nr:transglycosylase SLT domain-containing protein [Candidatus Liminaster caballi]
MKRYLFAIICGVIVGLGVGSYFTYEAFFDDDGRDPVCRSWSEIVASDTLRVVSVPSSFSVFEYKGAWRGHEYEMISQVAHELGLVLDVMLVRDEQALLDSIRSGAADVAVWPTFYSMARQDGAVRACGYKYEVGLVPMMRKDITVRAADSAAYSLIVAEGRRPWVALHDTTVLRHFDLTPFRLEVTEADSLTMEMLVDRVAAGDYDATLVPTNLAQLLRTFYSNLKVGSPLVESEDSVSWVVSVKADTLAMKIDSVCRFDRTAPRYAAIAKRYFEKSRGNDVKIRYLLNDGRLSVFDGIFKLHSQRIGWDWRMLAAVAYVESRFDPHEISSKGARGLMQLMPATAESYGCHEAMMTEPDANVAAGARLIESLENSLRSRISRVKEPGIERYADASQETRDAIERDLPYFTLAGYNAGLGHIFDAIALADTLGYDPAVWKDNVEHCLNLKIEEHYYTMPCVRLGRFNAEVTVGYVQEVLDTYEEFCRRVKN